MTRSWSIAIFVAVFSLYLLSSSREPAWGDAHPMWEVAESLADRGGIDVHTRWPEDLPPGRDGKIYCMWPIAPSLVHVPGAALTYGAHRLAPSYDKLSRPLFTHLAPAVLGALACVMFCGLLRDLGARDRTASLCTAILAVATTTWVYARYPYSEILQLVCFIGLFRSTLSVIETPTKRQALWLGLWAGALFNTKFVFALAIAGALAMIAWQLRKRRSDLARVAVWTSITGGAGLAIALLYNFWRWESFTKTGYEYQFGSYFDGSIFDGAWGMLLSPSKSALLFSPPLVLALFGLPHMMRKRPSFGVALAAIVVPTFLVYCAYKSWSGDYAWGPRYFVWAVPVLLVGLAGFWEGVAAKWRPWVRSAVLGAVVAAGICVQLLGNALYWDHFIRISITVKNQWLGNPNRSGSYIPDRGRGHCDSCFEDTYQILWTPPFQAIRGNWWLVKSIARGDDWQTAQVAAPWRRYTSLETNIEDPYKRARIDWWGLLWIKDATNTWVVGFALLLLFVAGTASGAWMWIRLHRTAADP